MDIGLSNLHRDECFFLIYNLFKKKTPHFVQPLPSLLPRWFWRCWASNDRWRMVHDPAKKKFRFSKCFIAKNAVSLSLRARRLLKVNRFFRDIFWCPCKTNHCFAVICWFVDTDCLYFSTPSTTDSIKHFCFSKD